MKKKNLVVKSKRFFQLKFNNITCKDSHSIYCYAYKYNDFNIKCSKTNMLNNNLEQQMDCLFLDVILTANTGADAIKKAPIVDYNTGIKCVRVGDMSNDRCIYDWGYTKITDSNFKQYQLKKDDIIITRTATLGLNKLITDDLNAVYNNGLIRISIDKNKVLPLFLYRQFQTNNFFSFINRIEAETSVKPNMKINYLLSYPFRCSNIELQKNNRNT